MAARTIEIESVVLRDVHGLSGTSRLFPQCKITTFSPWPPGATLPASVSATDHTSPAHTCPPPCHIACRQAIAARRIIPNCPQNLVDFA